MFQKPHRRLTRWSLLAFAATGAVVLAGCSGGGSPSPSGSSDDLVGFSVMVSQANDQDDYYAQILDAYSTETGVPVEVIPYPADAYNTQVSTQLQAGTAADMMILAPGTGQVISVVSLAEAGFLEPLDETSASVIPAGSESEYVVDGETYAQPTALAPVGLIWNGAAAAEAGIDEYPASYDDLLTACTAARDAGKSFTVLAGAIGFNTGLMSMLISATRVYEETPDWNAQRTAGEVTFAGSEGWHETLEDLVEMNESGCFQDGVAGGTFDNITQGMASGSALTAAVPGSAAFTIGEGAGIDLVVQAFPPASGQEAFTLASANYAWASNAASDDAVKASVQAFLDWVAQPEQAATFAELSGFVPITGLDPATLQPEYAPIADLLESGAFVGAPNATWPNPGVYDALGVGVQGLLTGQATVDSVLESMDAAWDQ